MTEIPTPADPAEGVPASRTSGRSRPAAEAATAALATDDLSVLLGQILRQMAAGAAPNSAMPDEQRALKSKLNKVLASGRRPTVMLPECADVLLALIDQRQSGEGRPGQAELNRLFTDYFRFGRTRLIDDQAGLRELLDPQVFCESGIEFGSTSDWPPGCCVPTPCVRLAGRRHPFSDTGQVADDIERIYLADVLWLYYFDRFGVFQILGRILDEFATRGAIKISSGSVDPDQSDPTRLRDDVIAVILETMTRQLESGHSSKVRDRDSVFQRCLGWSNRPPAERDATIEANVEFETLFHGSFMPRALDFYRDKRLAVAIRSTAQADVRSSAATLTQISKIVSQIRKSSDRLDYGRNGSNTVAGIIWLVSALTLIRDLRSTLGIPPEQNELHEFVNDAYFKLVRPGEQVEPNRYENHENCARYGRALLLSMAAVDFTQDSPGGELEAWLNSVESVVEGYRTAYQNVTGIDLGAVPVGPR